MSNRNPRKVINVCAIDIEGWSKRAVALDNSVAESGRTSLPWGIAQNIEPRKQGGEFVVGGSSNSQGLSRRDIMAQAALSRMEKQKKLDEQADADATS